MPDNLKSGVDRASFYDPEINRSDGMMPSHYGVGVQPARPTPEGQGQGRERRALCLDLHSRPLRRQTFLSLAEV